MDLIGEVATLVVPETDAGVSQPRDLPTVGFAPNPDKGSEDHHMRDAFVVSDGISKVIVTVGVVDSGRKHGAVASVARGPGRGSRWRVLG
jgi:hypothetical protein